MSDIGEERSRFSSFARGFGIGVAKSLAWIISKQEEGKTVTDTPENGRRTDNTPLTLADIQALLQTELANALTDLAIRSELEQRLAALEQQQPVLNAEMRQQQAAVALVEDLFHDIKSSLEGLNGRLDNYGQIIDARQEEVELLRTDQQRMDRDLRRMEGAVAKIRAQQHALRQDVFGTGEPHGPVAFAERVLAGIEGLAQQMDTNYEVLAARFAELEGRQATAEAQVTAHEAFIRQRQALEQGMLTYLKQLYTSRLLRRLLLVLLGGGSGLVLLEIVRQWLS